MSNGSKALGRSDPVGYSGVAADKNVRAPVASPKSSRFAQTFAYNNPGRRSRNQSGARTFLSAAMSNGSKALERYDPVEYSGVAADKNVRAPVAFQKSSRFAQTFAYSKIQRAGVRSGSCGGALGTDAPCPRH